MTRSLSISRSKNVSCFSRESAALRQKRGWWAWYSSRFRSEKSTIDGASSRRAFRIFASAISSLALGRLNDRRRNGRGKKQPVLWLVEFDPGLPRLSGAHRQDDRVRRVPPADLARLIGLRGEVDVLPPHRLQPFSSD